MKKRYIFLPLLFLFSCFVIYSSYRYYNEEKKQILSQKSATLHSITDLKIQQILAWKKERLGDAGFHFESPLFSKAVENYLKNPKDTNISHSLVHRLNVTKKYFDYGNVILASKNGAILTSADSLFNTLTSQTKFNIDLALREKKVIFGDFDIDTTLDKIFIDCIAPIFDSKNSPLAALVLRVYPEHTLYPAILYSPISSTSLEITIIKQSGDSVLFLNDLRHTPNAPLKLKISLEKKEISAVRAILGHEGLFQGKDYRGVPVLADIQKIPTTPWFITTKIDESEALNELQFRGTTVIIIVALFLIFSAAAITGLFFFYSQRELYKEKFLAENQLRSAEEEFRTVLYSIGDAVITTDTFGNIRHMNSIAETLTGWKEAESIGLSIREVFHIINEETREQVSNPIDKVLAEGRIVGLANHTILISKDGKEIPIADSGAPIKKENNQIIGVVLVFRDQTEERKALQILQEQQRFLSELQKTARIGNYSFYTKVNKWISSSTLDEIFGIPSDYDKSASGWIALIHPEEQQIMTEYLQNVLTTTRTFDKEYRILRISDGMERWVHGYGKVETDAVTKSEVMIGVIQDITEQKKAIQQIQETTELYDSLVNSLPQNLYRSNTNGEITFANKALFTTLGVSLNQLIGKTAYDFYPPELAKKYCSDDNDVIKTGTIFHDIEESKDSKTGKKIYVEIIKIPIINSNGEIVGIQGMFWDVSERKLAEDKIQHISNMLSLGEQIAHLGSWELDYETNTMWWSDELFRIFGLAPNSVQPTLERFIQNIHSDDQGFVQKTIEGGIKNKTSFHYNARIVRSDGTIRYVHSENDVVVNNNGELLRVFGTGLDITEQQQTEVALRTSEERYRKLIDTSPDGIAITDRKGNLRFLSTKALQMFGGAEYNKYIGVPVLKWISPFYHEKAISNLMKVMQGKYSSSDQYLLIREDGTTFHGEINAAPLIDENGNVEGMAATIRDITDRVEAIANIKKLSQVVEQSPASVVITDKEGIILYVNKTFVETTGYSIDEAIGNTPSIVKSGKTEPYIYKEMWNNLTSGKEWRGILCNKKKNGELFWEEAYISPLFDEFENVTNYVALKQDITEKMKISSALKESEERYRLMMVNSPDFIMVQDQDKNFVYVGPQCERVLGYTTSEIFNSDFFAKIHPEDLHIAQSAYEDAFNEKEINAIEYRYFDKAGFTQWLSHSARPVVVEEKFLGVQSTIRNITTKKQGEIEKAELDKRIIEMQKMDSIGTLASGIAHDFNNLLGIIIGHISLIERFRSDEEKFQSSLAIITKTVNRGAGLVRQILTFARRTDVKLEYINVNTALKETQKMLHETFPRTVPIDLQLEKAIPVITIDSTQFNQAIINLCVNAKDAMQENGTITITTSLIQGNSIAQKFPAAANKDFVAISIRDTGAGIDEETQHKIFEPFFTTKEKGKGTGLGLSVVFGVMQNHNGFVDVESEVNKGTTFMLYFPIPEGVVQPIQPQKKEEKNISGGTETVLIVEDEQPILQIANIALSLKGYTVLTASNGIEGLEIFKKNFETIDLVFSDLGLPKLSGDAMFEEMKKIKPAIKAIFATGYLEPNVKIKLENLGVKKILNKPFNPDDMLIVVREILDEK